MRTICFLVLASWNAAAMQYSTKFPATENPISESGHWRNGAAAGLDWCNVQTAGGFAWGVGPCPTAYADPTAVVQGDWGAHQTVRARARVGTTNAAYYQEIELRLRTTIQAHRITGYEINFGVSHAYLEIVRWNGPLADFTYLGTSCAYPEVCGRVSGFTIRDGDVATAVIAGATISVYVNGTLRAKATDSTFTSGSPGVGYNYGCDGTYAQFGWRDFWASDAAAPPPEQ